MLLTVPAIVRGARRARADSAADAPARVLTLAVTALPASHREWGRAMSAELEAVRGAGPRWRFSLGCATTAAVIWTRVTLTSRRRGGARLRAVIGTGLLAAVALAGYGLIRYPGLRSRDPAISAAAFVALLATCAGVTLALSRETEVPDVTARRHGLAGGALIGAAWLVVLSPPGVLKEWVLVPLTIALLGPGCIANGRPYDPQLLRDLPHSGAPDLATLPVHDALTSALTRILMLSSLGRSREINEGNLHERAATSTRLSPHPCLRHLAIAPSRDIASIRTRCRYGHKRQRPGGLADGHARRARTILRAETCSFSTI